MSEIKLADILIRKRREKGITQEELAEYIGVSKAAVSKWEKEQSYPDITLLPQLATYFNLSIDELLNYSPQLTREDARKTCQRLSASFTTQPFDEVMTECRSIIRKYYSCFPLLYQMAVLLVNHHMLAKTQEAQEAALTDAKNLCDRIIIESGDALLSKDALYLKCYCSLGLNNPDDVFALIGESLQMVIMTEDSLISNAFLLAGNKAKAKEITQCGMYQYITSLIESTLTYITLTDDDFTAAELSLNKVIELIRLYNFEKLNADLSGQAYLIGANIYSLHGYKEKALTFLEKYADLCIKIFFPFQRRGDSYFNAVDPWLDTCQTGSSLPRDERIVKQSMLQGLSIYPSLAILADEQRYKHVVRKLTEFAKA